MTPLKIVTANSALRLKALLDFEDGDQKRIAGDRWLFEGPGIHFSHLNAIKTTGGGQKLRSGRDVLPVADSIFK